jgi:hypothetical protein
MHVCFLVGRCTVDHCMIVFSYRYPTLPILCRFACPAFRTNEFSRTSRTRPARLVCNDNDEYIKAIDQYPSINNS